MLEAQKVRESISDQYVVPLSMSLNNHMDNFWRWLEDEDGNLCCGKQAKALLSGIILTIFGLIVLSFDSERSRPGTTVVRNKIFGIEQRYFLVYYNGLLLYLFMMYFEE